MGKRILFISCGKRNGNTWQAAQVVARSAGNSGAETMLIEAGRLEGIGRGCIGCMKCQKSAEFGCVLGDEVAELIMEMAFSPIGYRITRKWQAQSVGKPYLDYIEGGKKA